LAELRVINASCKSNLLAQTNAKKTR
jgi:hypothetical protein